MDRWHKWQNIAMPIAMEIYSHQTKVLDGAQNPTVCILLHGRISALNKVLVTGYIGGGCLMHVGTCQGGLYVPVVL